MTLFTLLPAPTAPGLCIRIGEEWVEIEIEPDELLLTPGLLLEHLTAGAYRACMHTVEHETTLGASRLSTPFFFKPCSAAVLFVADCFKSRPQAELSEARLADLEANYFKRAFAPSSATSEL